MVRRVVDRIRKKIDGYIRESVQGKLGDVDARIRDLEYRSVNRRFYAVEQIAEYLVGAQVPGDYLEFGVYQGATFRHAFKCLSPYFREMRFVAFDSFEGLPEPRGVDAAGGYTGNFRRSDFACSEAQFRAALAASGADMSRVRIVKGWFDETLLPGKEKEHGIDKAAVAWIDCDLYESTVPVLKFLTPRLSAGSVIAFDDWRCFRNSPEHGEQKACREWLAANPRIRLDELFAFGWNGMTFTVTSC